MRKINKKLMLGLTVLATPFVAENVVEKNVASANSTYNLAQNSKVYTNAQNAAKQKNATQTYTKGTYYIYKQYNGMINISKTPGKPGAWINPSTNKVVAAPKVETTTQTKSKTTSVVPKQTQQVKTTQVSTTTKTVTTSTVKKQEPIESGVASTYVLNNSVKAYTNASLAQKQTSVKTTYAAGNYYIYKTYNGMYNISKTKGRVGAWINPIENKVLVSKPEEQPKAEVKPTQKPAEKIETKTKTTQKPEEQPKAEVKPTQKTAEKTEAKAKTINQSKTEEKTTQKATENPKTEAKTAQKPVEAPKKEQKIAAGEAYTLTAKTSAYTNAALAASKSGSTRDYEKGQYYIYKVYNGMINISKTKGKVGAWINPSEVTTATTNPTSAETPAKKEEEILKVLPFANKNYKITSPYAEARNISSLGLRDIHNGVDFVTDNKKEEILSTEAGTVVGAGISPYGDGAYYVTIRHADDSYTSYWHLAKNSITVKTGQKVAAGQKIGVIGTTGLSTGIHLHFMHATTSNIFSSHQDPIKYLKSLNK